MPEKETIERAKKDKREGKAASTQAGEFVREEIEHVREGKHGARSTKQAIAIGLSKARRAGVKLPRRKELRRKRASRLRRICVKEEVPASERRPLSDHAQPGLHSSVKVTRRPLRKHCLGRLVAPLLNVLRRRVHVRPKKRPQHVRSSAYVFRGRCRRRSPLRMTSAIVEPKPSQNQPVSPTAIKPDVSSALTRSRFIR